MLVTVKLSKRNQIANNNCSLFQKKKKVYVCWMAQIFEQSEKNARKCSLKWFKNKHHLQHQTHAHIKNKIMLILMP